MTAPAEPTLDELVTLVGQLLDEFAVTTTEAIAWLGEMTGLPDLHTCGLLLARAEGRVYRFDTPAVTWDEGDDWRPVTTTRAADSCSICGATFIGGHCPNCGWF